MWVFLSFFAATGWCDPPGHSADLIEVIEGVQHPPAPGADRSTAICPTCTAASRKPVKLAGIPSAKLKAAMAKWSCEDVFGDKPPARIGKTKEAEWFPFCSAAHVEDLHGDGKPYSQGYRESLKWLHEESDICARPSTENRDSPNYIAPTRVSQGLTLMKDAERAEMETQIQKFLEGQILPTCCGSLDGECAKAMRKVRIEWCKPEPDPKKPDPCIENGTNFNLEGDENNQLFQAVQGIRASTSPRAAFQVQAGRIQISPMYDKHRVAEDSLGTVAHELGHACSMIRMQLAARDAAAEGSKDAVEAIAHGRYETSWCTITDEVARTYNRAYHALGLGDASSSCLKEQASRAVSKRFKEGDCEGGCPKAYLEETYANLMWIRSMNADQWYPEALPGFCYRVRDDQHPLNWDDMTCFLKTPSFAEWAKGRTGCAR